MDKKMARKWSKALRSGKYKQGKHELYTPSKDSYCCLGVLCRINGENEEVMEQTGLSLAGILRKYGMSGHIESTLMTMNDDNESTFEEIADVIDIIIAEDMWHDIGDGAEAGLVDFDE